MKISALSGIDLNNITVDGHYRINGGCTNVPITGGEWEQWTQLLVITGIGSDNTTQIMPIYYTGDVWLRTIKAPGVWTPWRKIATATPPQEFDLPLASGWSNYGVAVSRYSKDQFGQVSVIIDITNAGAIASGSTVATLPAGFRPANPFDAPAIISNDPKGVGKCYFRPNGEIAIAGIGTASWDRVDYFTAQASFVASS